MQTRRRHRRVGCRAELPASQCRNRVWKEEIKEGNCKITRERTSSGEYKEDRDY